MSEDMLDQIKKEIAANEIVMFIKGTKEMPMCGFSARTIAVFKELGRPFKTVDILPDPRIRQTLSAFSNWPTIPQVFINGKFVGGCDIVTEMYQKGELKPLVEAAFSKK
ncbi:MAG TPA: Grx4 family monothiol glutaredoxin [Candidatus Polarisedimenticolia bacterium]